VSAGQFPDDGGDSSLYDARMPKSQHAKQQQRSENSILDQATQQLLQAAKQEAEKRGTPIAADTLRQDGYSERFIDKVENA
jgi:hypothetical protein